MKTIIKNIVIVMAIGSTALFIFAGCSKYSASNSDNFIDIAKAREIAVKDAGLVEDKVTFSKCYLDYDDKKPSFDIEFIDDTYEYDYEVDAITSEIIQSSRELKDNSTPPSTQDVSSSPQESTQDTQTDKNPDIATSSDIGVEKAKQIALDHAGINASDATIKEAKKDIDNGITEYEIEFYAGNYEYDYSIDAESGKILSFDKDDRD